MRIKPVLLMSAVLALGTCAWAQESPTATEGATRDVAAAHDAEVDAHPDLSSNDAWAIGVVKVIALLFVLAAVIGPWVKLNVPKEVPPAHSHDEPPGASHHHGTGGEIAPHPH